MAYKYYFLYFASISFSTALSAGTEMIGITCSNSDFLACMHITTEKCESAYLDAKKDCTNKFPHASNTEESALISRAKKYAQCSTSSFISNMGTDSAQLESCFTFVQPTYDKYIEQLRKAQSINE